MAEPFVPDRSKFRGENDTYITQSLFLEVNYDTDKAIYTLTDEDKEYKGRVYPSLRRLYLETADPTEYEFANKYLAGWQHWQRITGNKLMAGKIEEWREELEVKLRSAAIRNGLSMADESFQAAKWAAEGGWKQAKVGRPKKDEQEKERRIRERIDSDTESERERIANVIKMRDRNG